MTQSMSGNPTTQRGALIVSVAPSTSIISAGSSFSIAVNITNPFEIPVIIGSVSTQLPVELYDVLLLAQLLEQRSYRNRIEALRYDLLRQLGSKTLPSRKNSFTSFGGQFLEDIIKSFIPGGSLILSAIDSVFINSTAVARNVQDDDPVAPTTLAQFIDNAERTLNPPKTPNEKTLSEGQIQTKVDEIIEPLQKEYEINFKPYSNQEILLQPGNSTTNVFVIQTKHNLTFKPASYSLHILISYKIDGLTHSQSLPYSLSIQASLASTMIGAVLGSFLGVIAINPDISAWTFPIIAPKIISSLVLSIFAIIAFARKEGVQPLLAIQDFWGGALIGFLVGYSGVQVLGNIFGSTQTPTSS